MDVSQANTHADDQNTNQNETTLTCRPLLGSDQLSNCTVVLEKRNNIENGFTILERIDNQDQNNTGTCQSSVATIIAQHTGENISIEHHNECQIHKTTSNGVVGDFHNENESSGLVCDRTNIPNLTNSDCVKSPSDRETQNHSNESSAVDISVTSDEDVKVTCRFSSTPVNCSLQKTLNDTDCSMSSVGDASPILTVDTEIKVPINTQHCQTPLTTANLQMTKDIDRVDATMMYMQPQLYGNKTSNMRNPPARPEYPQRVNPYYVDRNQTPPGFQQNYSDQSLRPYTVPPFDYQSFPDTPGGYSEYHPSPQRSFTDLKTRQEINLSPQADMCCYPMPSSGMSDRDYFVYPSIYVSNAGLISVLLRNDMSVEMTVDRTIRVVSHNHMMAVATDSKGTAASLYHPAAKIFQMGYNTDIATDTFRAKMTQGEAIFFSNGINCFKLQESELKPMAPIKFSDINRDQSVNLLFSSEGYGESLVATCMQVAAQAEYANLPKGGVIVRINGVKVTQSGCGDVTVVTGAKFIRLSPHNGTTRLGNRFVDIEVERDWSVKLTRGTHSFVSTKKRTMVSNGKMETGFDENNSLKVINLQSRHPLVTEPNIIRRPGKRLTKTPPANMSANFTPRRRVLASGGARGGINTC